MNIVAIVLVFISLGALALLGIVLTGFGINRLQHIVKNSGTTVSKVRYISLDILMAAVGLLLLFYGTFGTYRIIWGS